MICSETHYLSLQTSTFGLGGVGRPSVEFTGEYRSSYNPEEEAEGNSPESHSAHLSLCPKHLARFLICSKLPLWNAQQGPQNPNAIPVYPHGHQEHCCLRSPIRVESHHVLGEDQGSLDLGQDALPMSSCLKSCSRKIISSSEGLFGKLRRLKIKKKGARIILGR